VKCEILCFEISHFDLTPFSLNAVFFEAVTSSHLAHYERGIFVPKDETEEICASDLGHLYSNFQKLLDQLLNLVSIYGGKAGGRPSAKTPGPSPKKKVKPSTAPTLNKIEVAYLTHGTKLISSANNFVHILVLDKNAADPGQLDKTMDPKERFAMIQVVRLLLLKSLYIIHTVQSGVENLNIISGLMMTVFLENIDFAKYGPEVPPYDKDCDGVYDPNDPNSEDYGLDPRLPPIGTIKGTDFYNKKNAKNVFEHKICILKKNYPSEIDVSPYSMEFGGCFKNITYSYTVKSWEDECAKAIREKTLSDIGVPDTDFYDLDDNGMLVQVQEDSMNQLTNDTVGNGEDEHETSDGHDANGTGDDHENDSDEESDDGDDDDDDNYTPRKK
jgi:hypothetical protein